MIGIEHAMALLNAFDEAESSIPVLQRGGRGRSECGWECTACKATNAASDERCPWCRSYRLEPRQTLTQQDMNMQIAFANAQAHSQYNNPFYAASIEAAASYPWVTK